MGFANVAAVYLRFGHLDDRSLRLLVWMAQVSLDPPGNPMLEYQPCRYWQGWEAQAEALGYEVPPPGDKRRPSVYRQLQKVRARLVDAGAIERIERPNPGLDRRSVWELRLDP